MHISQLSFIWGHAKPANYHFCTGEDLWSFFKVLSWSAVICSGGGASLILSWAIHKCVLPVDLAPWQCEGKPSNFFLLSWKHFLELVFYQEFPFILILGALVTNTNTWYCVSLGGEVWSILTRRDSVRSHLVLPVTRGNQGCASVAFLSPLLQLFPSW